METHPQSASRLYENIKALCNEKGLSIAYLERETGLGNGVIRKWDKASPQLRTVMAVANYLGVTLDELLTTRHGTPQTKNAPSISQG